MVESPFLDLPEDPNSSFAKRFAAVLCILEVKQANLADYAEVTDRAIRGWLNGVIPFRPNLLSIQGFTGFSPNFLLAAHPASNVSGLNFWARVAAPKYVKARFAAFVSIAGEFIQQVSLEIQLPAPRVAQVHAMTSRCSPSDAARRVRDIFELGDGPIDALQLAESLGVVAMFGPPEGFRIDAYSAWVDKRPVIVLNPTIHDEFRLWHAVAHELGHLFMHDPSVDVTESSREIREREAEVFARELLIPWSAQTNDILSRAVRTRGPDALSRARNIYRTTVTDLLSVAKQRELERPGFIDVRAVEFNASGISSNRTTSTPRFSGPALLPNSVALLCEARNTLPVALSDEFGIPPRFVNLMISRTAAEARDADRVTSSPLWR